MNTNLIKKISAIFIASVAVVALALAILPSVAEAKIVKSVKKTVKKVALGYVTPGYTIQGYTVPGYRGIKLVPKAVSGYGIYRPSR
jgi:hypothetical protein